MSFAENLKSFREGKSLSQAKLAEMTAVSQPMIAQYEKGMKVPTIIVGVNLARALNTTVEELVNGK
jgi:DNA-binding helix-turn-helix protein